METLYVYPYDGRLDDRALQAAIDGGDQGVLWPHLAESAARAGLELRHVGELAQGTPGPVLALNEARGLDLRCDAGHRRVCLAFEPPIVDPRPWARPDVLLRAYDKVYLAFDPRAILPGRLLPPWRSWAQRTGRFRYMQFASVDRPQAFSEPRERLVCLVNGNKKGILPYRELYSRRVQALLAFSPEEATLHGTGWDAPVRARRGVNATDVRAYWKGPVADKGPVMSRHSFAITFENMDVPGYVTEKLFDAMVHGAVPIYLGAPDVATLVPRNCFIDARAYSSMEELAESLRTLPDGEIQGYRDRILEYLRSDAYRRLGPRRFSDNAVAIVKDGQSLDWVDPPAT